MTKQNLLKFQPDLSRLRADENAALPYLVDAVSRIDPIYQGQLGPDLGANLYPADITRDEFQKVLEREKSFAQFNTLVRRRVSGELYTIPYEIEYKQGLLEISKDLSAAAGVMHNPSFRHYLQTKAAALLDGSYDESDKAWLAVRDCGIQLVIGPIETYIDRFMGIKASYEGIVAVRETQSMELLQKIASISVRLRGRLFDQNLFQSDDKLQIEVDNVIEMGGHANATRMNAKTLPNNEEIIAELGSRKMLFKNVIETRFENVLKPILNKALTSDHENERTQVDGFMHQGLLAFVLSHELWHTLYMPLGFNRQLVHDAYTPLEEAKAHFLALATLKELYMSGVLTWDAYRASVLGCLCYMYADIRLGSRLATRSAYKAAALLILAKLSEAGCLDLASVPNRVSFAHVMDKSTDIALDFCLPLHSLSYEAGRDLVHQGTNLEATVEPILRNLSDVPLTI